MAEVARDRGVRFVDLFGPTARMYAEGGSRLTINGIHLNAEGNRRVAEVLDASIFGPRPAAIDWAALEPLRAAVLDKAFHWFHRYRTTDGYSTYGGRADLAFVDGQTNREVMARELAVLDGMTANRDRRIWALAQGRDAGVDDSGLPPLLTVKTNKPGEGPNGEHVYLGGEEAIGKMTVQEGLRVELFASEERFPELINPVQMAFDPKGRLWVAAWPSYPHWKPGEPMDDKLLILEDTDGDGKADVCKTFAGGLHNPTGFEFWNGGVLVAMAPDLLFLEDTDGDDRADRRTRVLSGLDSADTHHTANSFVLDPSGALYFQEGVFHRTQAETPRGPVRNVDAAVWRFEPRTWRLERYVPFGFANPHGHAFDRWGQDFVVDGTGANPYHATLFSGHLDFPDKHPGPPQLYQQRTRPCPAIEVLSSRHFGPEFEGDLLVGNVIGFSGILRYDLEDRGASFRGVEAEPMVFSSDPNFRPADVEVGPDGAVWFVDWHNPVIGHMQHNLRDPSRDRVHGRVYRVVREGVTLDAPEPIAGQPLPALMERLKSPQDRVRYRARIELSARPRAEVVAAVRAWEAALDANDPAVEHHRTEALWALAGQNVVDAELLGRVLGSPVAEARAAAVRVLCHWRDRLPDPVGTLRRMAGDAHPRVRLEAVRALSFFDDVAAADAALEAVRHPRDEYLDYTLGETMRRLEPRWRAALQAGAPVAEGNPAGVDYLLDRVGPGELGRLPRTDAVLLALLTRPQVAQAVREEALGALAERRKAAPAAVLLGVLRDLDAGDEGRTGPVIRELAALLFPPSQGEGHAHHGHGRGLDLAAERAALEGLAFGGRQAFTRQVAMAALMAAAGSVDPVHARAAQEVRLMRDWLGAVALVPDAALRTSAFARVAPLLEADTAGWPEPLAREVAGGEPGVVGRYVRIELPRPGTLTLAEVEVESGGRNVARDGRAQQSSTAYGARASRAIDGNVSGVFGDGGQTHTDEGDPEPWWEVDLGREVPIEAIVVRNRSEAEGRYADRLEGFALRILDEGRKEVFARERNGAPAESARFELESDPRSRIRRAAMAATVATGAEPAAVFRKLSGFVRAGDEREAALRALGSIPAERWPREELRPLVDVLLAAARGRDAESRRSPVARDELRIAQELATRLPADEAGPLLAELRGLGVPVVLIRPVPHQILFDRSRFYVEAGKPFELVFENVDIMPHNLVITAVGQMAKVGVAGEAMAASPDAYARNFVPELPEVIRATRLLQPGQTERLLVEAPAAPGDYPYVCTFPGHWTRMNGVMHVVSRLEDVPREELLASTAPVSTPGAARPFVRAWTFEDLAGDLDVVRDGRDPARGAALFRELACVQCHAVDGQGGRVGPDMAELRKELAGGERKPEDVLRSMVEPSAAIEDRYRTQVVALASGETITGVVVEETDDVLTLSTNPLAPEGATVRTIPKVEIEERAGSQVSIMPQGLLNTLQRDEVLELLHYVTAGGG
jgi:putative heme-binding domain-containing protein